MVLLILIKFSAADTIIVNVIIKISLQTVANIPVSIRNLRHNNSKVVTKWSHNLYLMMYYNVVFIAIPAEVSKINTVLKEVVNL